MAEQACTIGRNMALQGDVSGDEALVVAGRIEGSITLNNMLSIEPDGVVQATVDVHDLAVGGSLEGAVRAAGNVTIQAGGRVVGNITAQRISIEDGAYFSGRIEMDIELPEGVTAK